MPAAATSCYQFNLSVDPMYDLQESDNNRIAYNRILVQNNNDIAGLIAATISRN